MNSKLKTFKNLEIYHQDRILLKQEAIKHILHKRQQNKTWENITKSTCVVPKWYEFNLSLIDWIKHFFNINEEDL